MIEELLDQYATFQRRRGFSDATIEVRARVVSAFFNETDLPPEEVTAEDIESWLDTRRGMRGQPFTAKSRYCYMSHLSNFYKAMLDFDPLDKVARPRVPRGVPRPIEDDDLDRAITHAFPPVKLLLLLGAYAGLRCVEMAGLKRGDITERGIFVRGKGSHERMVPTHPEILANVNGQSPDSPLFPGYTSGKKVSETINGYLRAQGSRATAHQLRHWYATTMYRKTKDLRLIQDLLGHASPVTSAVYTKVSTDDARDAVASLGGHGRNPGDG